MLRIITAITAALLLAGYISQGSIDECMSNGHSQEVCLATINP